MKNIQFIIIQQYIITRNKKYLWLLSKLPSMINLKREI